MSLILSKCCSLSHYLIKTFPYMFSKNTWKKPKHTPNNNFELQLFYKQ